MSDSVAMWHPDIPATKKQPVIRSRYQFEVVWKERGWRLVQQVKTPAVGKGESDE